MIRKGAVKPTATALRDAASLDLELEGMIDIVLSLTKQDFYKSMTTYNDHRVWQDVYRPNTDVGDVYLKLTVLDDVLIVSFKAL